jgi:hypothetical protein
MGGRCKPAAHSLTEDNGPRYRLEDMSDDERTPDDAELEQTEDAADEDDDVEAHSLPLPPPRPMNGL